MNRYGQSAVEYLGIVVVLLAVFVPAAIIGLETVQEQRSGAGVDAARTAADGLVSAADTVCPRPDGTTRRVSARIPPPVDLSLSGVGRQAPRTVTLAIRTADTRLNVTATSDCRLTGWLPASSGTHLFQVTTLSDGRVNITPVR